MNGGEERGNGELTKNGGDETGEMVSPAKNSGMGA